MNDCIDIPNYNYHTAVDKSNDTEMMLMRISVWENNKQVIKYLRKTEKGFIWDIIV